MIGMNNNLNVEIFNDGTAYEMDINKNDGKIVTDTV